MKKTLLVLMAISLLFGSTQTFADSGKNTYRQACFSCHGTGVGGAPKIGDKAAWAPRIGKGMKTLYQAAIKGMPGTAMIPKGGLAQLSDKDVRAAVDFIINHSR